MIAALRRQLEGGGRGGRGIVWNGLRAEIPLCCDCEFVEEKWHIGWQLAPASFNCETIFMGAVGEVIKMAGGGGYKICYQGFRYRQNNFQKVRLLLLPHIEQSNGVELT